MRTRKKNLTRIYKFKVNNGNIRTICEIYSKLTKHQNDFSGILIVNFEPISYIFQVISIIGFEQVNPGWEAPWKNIFNFFCQVTFMTEVPTI